MLFYQFEAKTIVAQGRTSDNLISQIANWTITSPIPKLTHETIALFLLSCDNNLEATQNTIRNYFRIKKDAPEIFQNRDVDSSDLIKVAHNVACLSIPTRMEGNSVIHFFKLLDSSYSKFDFLQSCKLAYMLVDVSQRVNPPNDLVIVIDMQGVNLLHLTKLRLSVIKKFVAFLQEAMPLKIKIIHILNANYIFDRALALMRAFIKSELMEIIHTHAPGFDLRKFHKDFIPIECLPREYGGTLPTCPEINETMIEEFRNLKLFYEAEEALIQAYKL